MTESPSRVIEPPAGWRLIRGRELWRSRELLLFLGWRDVKVRYAQALLGLTWLVLQPVLLTAVFTLFLGRAIKSPDATIPYPLFVLSGLLGWNYFAAVVTGMTQSVVYNANLLTKAAFPRIVLPLSVVVAAAIDLAVAFAILVIATVIYGHVHVAGLLLSLPFLLLAALPAAALGIWFATANARFRDIGAIVPFVVQVGFFATPVVYSIQLVPRHERWLLQLNPMTGVVTSIRWAALGTAAPTWPAVAMTLAASAVVLLAGLAYFERMQSAFADII